jgi:hypothetical protein
MKTDGYVIKGVKRVFLDEMEVKVSDQIPGTKLGSVIALCVLNELGIFFFKNINSFNMFFYLKHKEIKKKDEDIKKIKENDESIIKKDEEIETKQEEIKKLKEKMEKKKVPLQQKPPPQQQKQFSYEGFSHFLLFIYLFIFFLLYKEIDVPEDFEIDNGMLGLIRGVYLSIVKFLDSPILRKV